MLRFISYNTFSLMCATFAFYGMLRGIQGWGWFLFVAAIFFSIPPGVKEE